MSKGMVKPITAGRMGNFLFQAAMAMQYAWRHGLEYTLPDSTHDKFNCPIYLQHRVNPEFDVSLPQVLVKENIFSCHEVPFKEEWRGKNIILQGWWQTEKYFKWCRDRIIMEFGFPWFQNPGTVSVHVRRGDYLRLRQKHPPVPKEWIEKAMTLFNGFYFTFFSDDPDWCEKQFGHRKDVIIARGSIEDDLVAMSHCEHHICSASTYSWWGAWLNQNPNKRIIMPKRWFMPGHGGLDTKDVVPAEWERL